MRKNTNFTSSTRRRAGTLGLPAVQPRRSSKPDAPFRNKLVRQAISYAIDREAIVKEIYYGEALATDNQIPAGYHRLSRARC